MSAACHHGSATSLLVTAKPHIVTIYPVYLYPCVSITVLGLVLSLLVIWSQERHELCPRQSADRRNPETQAPPARRYKKRGDIHWRGVISEEEEGREFNSRVYI